MNDSDLSPEVRAAYLLLAKRLVALFRENELRSIRLKKRLPLLLEKIHLA